MQSAQIACRTAKRPLHLRPAAALVDEWVSSESKWSDPSWYLDDETHGAGRKRTINWDMDVGNGESLLHPKYSEMLDWLRRFFWTLYAAPGSGAAASKPGTMSGFGVGLSTLVPWMVQHHVFWPHQLKEEVLGAYLDDLPEILLARYGASSLDETNVARGAAYRPVIVLYKLWQQRKVLEAAGIAPMPSKPWREYRGANSVVSEIATAQLGWIQPLPDEVGIPLSNRAVWFLETPRIDLLHLQTALLAAYNRRPGNHPNGPGTGKYAREKRQRDTCNAWTFSTPEGEDQPWHPPLRECGELPARRALQLIKALQSAAMLAIQGFTGIRVSELCGLPSGLDQETGLPRCVQSKPSASGLNEIFVLTTEMSKTEEAPRDRVWHVGLRPQGSTELPIPVKAMLLLEDLLDPYRKLIGSDRLLVSLKAAHGLPKTEKGVVRMTRDRVTRMYKDFIEEWVDLSNLSDQSAHPTKEKDLVEWRESRGRVITSHQLRKTFALYVLSVEPRLLPAVKREFQHIALAMTEGGYWGTNPHQIESLSSVSAQQTALMMFELATGRVRPAGKAAERLERGGSEVQELIKGLSLEAGWREAIKWVKANDVTSTLAPHGGCLPLAASEMECWKKDCARPLGHRQPNYATREPGLCAGCRCFWMDGRHVPFWQKRYEDNEIAYRQAVAMGQGDAFRRIRERARQARAFLSHIGVDLKASDQRIKKAVKSGQTR